MMINRSWMRPCLVISVVLFSGCSWFSTPPSLPGGYLIPSSEPDSKPVSRRVWLVADNQLHNVYGKPVPLLRSEFADKIVQSAIRPVQLDFYGQDFLKWLVEDQGRLSPIVHIGDACDFSCTGEFSRFWEIMRPAKKGWVMAPGNHDGFFFGNEHRNPTGKEWRAACANAGEPMTKDLLVRYYLASLVLQQGPGYQALARHLKLDRLDHADLGQIIDRIPPGGKWSYTGEPGDKRPFLRAVSWKIDKERPWRSFVVQEADMTLDTSVPVRVILLDTAQYDKAPRLVPIPPTVNAGITGEILPDQRGIAQSWIEANRDSVWVLVGHHPFDSLTKGTQGFLDDLRRSARVPLYVSAHTHAGQFIVHANGKDRWLELNVGSILDWSLEARTLQFLRTEEQRDLVLRSFRSTMHDLLSEFEGVPANPERWEAKPGEPDYYLRHQDLRSLSASKTEARLKNALLAAHHRLLRFNPTQTGTSPDAPFWPQCCKSDKEVRKRIEQVRRDRRLDTKIAFLIALDRFEQGRPVADREARSKFRLSQALWASKYDFVHARKPLIDDWFIVFPK